MLTGFYKVIRGTAHKISQPNTELNTHKQQQEYYNPAGKRERTGGCFTL